MRAICGIAVTAFVSELGCEVTITDPPFGCEIEMFRAIVAMDTDYAGPRLTVPEHGEDVGPWLRALLAQVHGGL